MCLHPGRLATARRIALTVVLTTLAGTSSWAALCQKPSGVLVSKPSCRGKLRAADPASLGLIGPKGDKGDQGDPGPGARWALVKEDGTILQQSGGISVTRDGAGEYYVDFGSSLVGMNLTVTAGCTNAVCQDVGTSTVAICGGGTIGYTCPAAFNDPSHAWVYLTGTDNQTTQDNPFFVAAF